MAAASSPADPLPSFPLGLADAELLAVLTRAVGATVALVNRDLQVVYCNDEYARWFTSTPPMVTGKTLMDLHGSEDRQRFMPFVQRVLAGERVEYQRYLHNPYGTEEWRSICLTPARSATGDIAGFITSALDVHELQESRSALRAANQRLSSHMDNSPLAVIELDQALRLVQCSRRAVQLMGWEREASLTGRALPDLLPTADKRLHLALQQLQLARATQNRAETAWLRADGVEVHSEWFNSALTDAQGRITSILSLVQDVSARVEIERQQQHVLSHDALTGLYNRSAFQERLTQALLLARQEGGCVALLFIDLDGFKDINDQHGHRAGDEVLRIVAQRLTHAVRAADTVGRLGGDEFLVLLDNDVTPELPQVMGERILDALNQAMDVDGHSLYVGTSIGVAVHPPWTGETEVLMGAADRAMYAAKRDGKGQLRHAPSGSG